MTGGITVVLFGGELEILISSIVVGSIIGILEEGFLAIETG